VDGIVVLEHGQVAERGTHDVVLPAATWYEKHDLSSTDMHPSVHADNPAISPALADPQRLRRLPHTGPRVLGTGGDAPGPAA
jgi:Molybdopterin oxidoreductase